MGSVRALTRWPVIQAPMGGGPSTPELAAAVSNSGGLGFLAAGYKTADAMLAEVAETKRLTGEPFGVNLFVPTAPADGDALDRYLARLEADASSLGMSIGAADWTDDDWEPKLAGLLRDPVAVVSFAFGCPSREIVTELQRVGSLVMVTVTTPDDTETAVEHGVDALCAQGIEAGAHRGGFTDDEAIDSFGLLSLLGAVRTMTELPIIAAGGIMDGRDLAAVLVAGAEAAQLGTAFLRSPESGAHDTYKAALVDPAFTTTAITRAFSGRRARGTREPIHGRPPVGTERVPADQLGHAAHFGPRPRVRGDPQRMSLWAGQGFRARRRAAGR